MDIKIDIGDNRTLREVIREETRDLNLQIDFSARVRFHLVDANGDEIVEILSHVECNPGDVVIIKHLKWTPNDLEIDQLVRHHEELNPEKKEE